MFGIPDNIKYRIIWEGVSNAHPKAKRLNWKLHLCTPWQERPRTFSANGVVLAAPASCLGLVWEQAASSPPKSVGIVRPHR